MCAALPRTFMWVVAVPCLLLGGDSLRIISHGKASASDTQSLEEAAQTTEEVEMAVNQMRYTTTYEKIFEPHKWDVIVRVLK